MALEFKCPKCSKEAIFKYLKVGETGKCPYCGNQVTISTDATKTGEESSITERTLPGGMMDLDNPDKTTVRETSKFDKFIRRALFISIIYLPFAFLSLCTVSHHGFSWLFLTLNLWVFFVPKEPNSSTFASSMLAGAIIYGIIGSLIISWIGRYRNKAR